MTLIYLLTGTHPAELPQVDGRVKFDAEISKRFERWLEKMTHPHLDKRFDSAKAAQLALKSEDGSYGNFNQLKPAHTQIRLYRDQKRLQITWHQANRNFSFPVFFGLLFCFLIIIIYVPSLWFIYVFLLLTGLSLLTGSTVFLEKTNYHLIIDDRRVYNLKDHKQGHNIKLSEHLRSQIEILAYNPGYTFDKCLDTNGRLIKGSTITIPPKLYLYCGSFEYSLPIHFSQSELWWLGQELSDFLNLELQVIYPTPKVPPAPSCGGGC